MNDTSLAKHHTNPKKLVGLLHWDQEDVSVANCERVEATSTVLAAW